MRLVIALGGNALLRRQEFPDSTTQEQHIAAAASALAPLAAAHELVVTHGNGPQVGMLAYESAEDPELPHPYPFPVIGAETQGMIGYWLLQSLENLLPGRSVASLICQTIVEEADPAFAAPTKFIGRVYDEGRARRLATEHGWHFHPDGAGWRRVVASPQPVALVEISTIRSLLDAGSVVVCAGGGGIPVVRDQTGRLHGVEGVIDKDLTAALLAVQLAADRLLILTDVAAVEIGFGTDHARPIHRTTPSELRRHRFPAGSMGPKVEALCRFVSTTGRCGAIGRLEDAAELLAGSTGTIVAPD